MKTERTIKFRAWDSAGRYMVGNPMNFIELYPIKTWMQFTGQHDVSGEEIYEGDIGRVTEELEEGDHNIYLICAWIKEWSMFAWVEHTEYDAYLVKGVEALDEFMFWTYNMENAGVTICGNIYEHPDYIMKCLIEEDKSLPSPPQE